MSAPKMYWMSLASPTARLIIKSPENPDSLNFMAYFHGLDRGELLTMIEHGISKEGRFCHQLRHPRSVLSHQILMYDFLKERYPEIAEYALVHDTPESFLHDTPKMIKDDRRSAIEDAIFQAFRFPFAMHEPSIPEKLALFKKYDTIASVVEAELYGYEWPWVEFTRKECGDAEVDEYKKFVSNDYSTEHSFRDRWHDAIYALVDKYQMDLTEKFVVDPELIASITHT